MFRLCRPLKRQVYDRSGFVDLLQPIQGCSQHSHLPFLVTWLSERTSQWVLDANHARGGYSSRQVRDIGQGKGREPRCLDLTLHQSNGPAADWSGRDQQDNVHLLRLQLTDHHRCGLFKELIRLQNITHKGIMRWRRITNLP